MNQTETGPTFWQPRPAPEMTGTARQDYLAGYSDGFLQYAFSSGHDGSRSRNSYRIGFNHGSADAALSEPVIA